MTIALPFGIDLGTTRTAAAAAVPGAPGPRIYVLDHQSPTFPSVILPGPDGWIVGDDALHSRDPQKAQHLLSSVKRWMGTDDELLGDHTGTDPEALSAAIIEEATRRCLTGLQATYPEQTWALREAVITVPAYFDAPQIEATRRAGEAAGLSILGLVQEPTAAAIYHCWRSRIDKGTFLVYDLGGGTFDVSIIQALYGEYQVLAIAGDNHLGGDDFDRRLAALFRQGLREAGVKLAGDLTDPRSRAIFDALLPIARMVKEELSVSDSVAIERPLRIPDLDDEIHLSQVVYKQDFEDAITDLLESTLHSSREALREAQERHDLSPTDIDGVFLVGGSTRVPAVREILLRELGPELDLDPSAFHHEEPETSVALGAAICAAALGRFSIESRESSSCAVHFTDLPTVDDPALLGAVSAPNQRPTALRLIAGSLSGDGLAVDADLSDDLEFTFDDVTDLLASSSSSDLRAQLLDSAGEPIVELPLFLPPPDPTAPPLPSLRLTNPAVLARDLNLEIVEDGHPALHTLVPRGSHLPTRARKTLYTGDQSGALVVRILQHHLPIHTVVLPLPDDVRPGTPLELTIHVDAAMTVTASGTIGEQSFWARIDRPTMANPREWSDIEDLLNRAAQVAGRLWGLEARRFQERWTTLQVGIRAAATQDPHRLQVLARRLQTLLDEYAPRKERTPGISRITSLLDTIRLIVFSSDTGRMGHSHDEWRPRIDALYEEATAAWEDDDDHRWRQIADRVQATFESVAQEEALFTRQDPARYAAQLQASTLRRLDLLREDLREFPFAEDPEHRQLQAKELKHLEGRIDALETSLPPEVSPAHLADFKKAARHLTQLERQVQRLHTLGVPRGGPQ